MITKKVYIPGITTERDKGRQVSRPIFDFAPRKVKEALAYINWLINVKKLPSWQACDVAASVYDKVDDSSCRPPAIQTGP